ncbi:MAG: ATP-binding protein [Nitrospira sp.]|nr:ATP-binding protein [Nitrospira sp.]
MVETGVDQSADNGSKHTPPGGSVTVRLRRSDGSLEIAVRDTGPGIEAEHAPFLRSVLSGGQGQGTGVRGTGLGLAIVKGIVEAHGGTVSVDTQPGKGSEFTIRLPLDRPPESHSLN